MSKIIQGIVIALLAFVVAGGWILFADGPEDSATQEQENEQEEEPSAEEPPAEDIVLRMGVWTRSIDDVKVLVEVSFKCPNYPFLHDKDGLSRDSLHTDFVLTIHSLFAVRNIGVAETNKLHDTPCPDLFGKYLDATVHLAALRNGCGMVPESLLVSHKGKTN